MARKSKAAHTLGNPKSVKAFKAWLTGRGAEVLPETNAYEVVRFRGTVGLSVIYRNNRGRPHAMAGEAQAAWSAFVAGEVLDLTQPPQAWITDADTRPVPMSAAEIIQRAARQPLTVAFVMEANTMPMREASVLLFGLERDGLLTRSGGEPGTALLWRPAGQPRVLRAIHSPAGA